MSVFQRDRVAMLTLPAAPYEPCEKVYRASQLPGAGALSRTNDLLSADCLGGHRPRC